MLPGPTCTDMHRTDIHRIVMYSTASGNICGGCVDIKIFTLKRFRVSKLRLRSLHQALSNTSKHHGSRLAWNSHEWENKLWPQDALEGTHANHFICRYRNLRPDSLAAEFHSLVGMQLKNIFRAGKHGVHTCAETD